MREKISNDLMNIFLSTDLILKDLNENFMTFSVLISKLSVALNWKESDSKKYLDVVKFYVKENPLYYVKRGAKCGICLTTFKNKQDLLIEEKNKIKKELINKIDELVEVK